MRHVKLILEYDGTAYGGWQRQANIHTIQQVLEEKLEGLLRHPSRAAAAGRTDAGVHAIGQVVCFKTDTDLSLDRIRKGLNALLPPDIAVAEASEVSLGFDPRRHARGKLYRYLIWNRPSRSALLRHRAWHVREPLDVGAMQCAVKELLGEHDFSAFQASGCEAKTPVRILRRLDVGHGSTSETGEVQGLLAVEAEATAFLRFMVRNIVGTLVEVGRGRLTPSEAGRILEGKDRQKAGQTAPARGLTLVRVDYEGVC